jgi:hypothetical protein
LKAIDRARIQMIYLIIRFIHPAMMTRYGCGAVRAQAYARRSVMVWS